MTDHKFIMSDEDKARLLRMKKKALFSSLGEKGSALHSYVSSAGKRNIPHYGKHSPSLAQKIVGNQAKPEVRQEIPQPVVPAVPPPMPPPPPPMKPISLLPVVEQKDPDEIELTREQCFSAVMDMLCDGMSRSDKASKQAAKTLLIVMGNEVGESVSLLVYNSYVRKYNALREQCFMSTTENIKAKTVQIKDELVNCLEQLAQTIKIDLPAISLPNRVRS